MSKNTSINNIQNSEDKTDLKIYMDYQSTTPLDSAVLEKMIPYMSISFGNPHSSEHTFGWEANKAVEQARSKVASYINALENEIIFTSGATESNNLAIIGTGYSALKKTYRRIILVSAIEHKCVLGASRFLEQFGFIIKKIPVLKDGHINLQELKNMLSDKVLLVSVMATNNEIGVNQPICEIGNLCHNLGIIFHVDASQGIYNSLNVLDQNIDLLSLSGHKIYGPKGIGALFINKDNTCKPSPIILGGGQQDGFRSGTIATPLAVGMGAALDLMTKVKENEITKLLKLRETLLNGLKENIPSLRINGDLVDRHPGNLNITIPNLRAQQLIFSLQPKLCFSTGSACTSGIPEPSHVLKALGLSTEEAESSFRITVGRFTTDKDVQYAIKLISDYVNNN